MIVHLALNIVSSSLLFVNTENTGRIIPISHQLRLSVQLQLFSSFI